eukprot:s402_g5.t1
MPSTTRERLSDEEELNTVRVLVAGDAAVGKTRVCELLCNGCRQNNPSVLAKYSTDPGIRVSAWLDALTMGEKSSDCVKVAIRCRPPSQKEINNGEESIVEMTEAFGEEGEQGQVVLSDPHGHDEPAKFAFDIVFGLSVAQVQIYESALHKTFEGYNGTIFAYGQTGSGKSFTMTGAPGDLRGIIPRVNEDESQFLVMCSFFEIYNEIIFDLLNPVSDRSKLGGGLQIKEHPVMGIYVKDLTEIVAEDVTKVETLLENGNKSRAVSSTLMNSTSSRSHSIFTIKIHQKDEEDTSRNVFAKLNLVDLAGSERQKGTGATGQTLKEGANINKSLSALGNVINALVETANGKKVFIPYRNSKLTRVLHLALRFEALSAQVFRQESLGGNSLCTMLATLSPAACNYEETMSTLRYANRAKAIKVSATKNEEASQVSRLKAEVEELKKKLAAVGSGGGPGGGGMTAAEKEAEQQKFQKQLKEMELMLNNNWEEKAKLSEEHERQMQRFREERERAAHALEEERQKRLRLLQEKNDLELSLRGLVDLVASASFDEALSVTSESHAWLKSHRSFRQDTESLSQQLNLVHVFKHGFDEDLKLWGEGAEAGDATLQIMGMGRSLPKLEKLRKGVEKLVQLESQCVSEACGLDISVKRATVELDAFRSKVQSEVREEAEAESQRQATLASLEQISQILTLIQKQLQVKLEELKKLTVEMGQTIDMVVTFSEGLSEGEVTKAVSALQALVSSPHIFAMPAGMPQKPLREYSPEEVQDTPETTEAVLRQLIRIEAVVGKAKKSAADLLARPPPKFLLDVAVALKQATGFPAQLEETWPDSREDRLARFQQIADAINGELGIQVDFDGVGVLKGKEVPKTLRVLQLLALGAARQSPPTHPTERSPAEGPEGWSVAEVPRILDSLDQCIRTAKTVVESQSRHTEEQSLQEKLLAIEASLAEEARFRLAQEESLRAAERHLQETKASLRSISAQCEQKEELQELEKQLEELSDPSKFSEDNMMKLLVGQLDAMKVELEHDQEEVNQLQHRRKEVTKALNESTSHARLVEAEVQRARQKREADEELIGQAPEEQLQILQARGQELRSRNEDLEQQLAMMSSEVEEHRNANRRLLQENSEWMAKAEDSQLQMQIVQEERDSLREAMEQLWTEKAQVDEDLEIRMAGYINLSERLNLQQDDNQDLEMQMEQKKEEIAEMQRSGFQAVLSKHVSRVESTMAIALHSPKALQRPAGPARQLFVSAVAAPQRRFGFGGTALPAVACGASAWLTSRAKRGLRQTATATDTTVREGPTGLLLVTGGSSALAELCTPGSCRVLHVPGTFSSLEDVQALIQRAEDEHPDQEIAGLLHIGGAASSENSSLAQPAATEALDESLRSLTLLVTGLVPHLKAGARLVTWSSDRAFASPSTWSDGSGGMAALAGAFVEQYTQALAHELRHSATTVYGLRISEEALRFALDPSLDPEAREKLEKEIVASWSLPHREAHGQIFPVGRPEVTFSTTSARGASVLGCSLDVVWALKDAAKDAAAYPVDGRPKTYQALAKALHTTPARLVWAHGASDVILRTALAAAKRSEGPLKALMQGPSWPNAGFLLRASGMSIDKVPYSDPWSADASQPFWQTLRERMARESPALVYLVHPHFPTGVKEPNFGSQLRDLFASGDFSKTLVAVDQTYLGFTEKTEDDDILETLAQFNNSVVLIRSLSKVEGLAGLRLGYAKSTAATADLIAETLPFSGGLYISEMALAGALAAIEGPISSEHRSQVLSFYQAEQAWLREQVEELGFETFESAAPFFVLRGPKAALEAVVEDGAALQMFNFDGETDDQRSPAVCLVADRASNLSTIRMLKSALEKTSVSGWADMLKPMLSG